MSGVNRTVPLSSNQQSASEWDHDSHDEFFRYYAAASSTPEARERFRRIRETVLRVQRRNWGERTFEVADIGCGAGTQSLLWAELGHRVHGLDVNKPLLDLARKRAAEAGHEIDFRLGSATSLPLADGSVDICLAVELIEHVADWQSCVNEFTRVLRPRGVLFISTTNTLCPRQDEFTLPLYSWYPAFAKRYCERLAVTTHPELANYAKYPAVNWFSYYGLRKALVERGFETVMDRFDLILMRDAGIAVKALVRSIRSVPPLRWLGHLATPGTTVVAVKSAR
jgi:2-polyprenyl-6-hydroxyphenyl methylase/3-demethylubiquinone-9 3-methyltransferase